MISAKIKSCATHLGTLAGKVPSESWELVRLIKAELEDAADLTKALEAHYLRPPGDPEWSLKSGGEARQ